MGSWNVDLENIWVMTSEYALTALCYISFIALTDVPNLVTHLLPPPPQLDYVLVKDRSE